MIRCGGWGLGLLLLTGCTPDRWQPTDRSVPPPGLEPVEAFEAGRLGHRLEDIASDAPMALPQTDAEGRLALRVEDAVLLALANNRDLRVRRHQPLIAATFEQIERGVYDPELFATLAYTQDHPSDGSDEQQASAVAGLRQRLPSGTDLALSAGHERSDDGGHESRLALGLTQALLRGLGPAVNLADIRQAALDGEISRYELRGFVEALIAETETAYWRLSQSERQIAIVSESLRLAALQRDDIAARIAVGTEPRSSSAATRSEVARREQALIEAEAQRNEARLRLLRLVTPFGRHDFDLTLRLESEATIGVEEVVSLDDRLALARQQRADLGEARLRLEQRRLACVVTSNGLLPRLDFFVGLGKTGRGPSLADAVGDIGDEGFDLELGLDFSYRLGDRSAAARQVAAVTGRQQAQAAIANLEQLVELELRLAWNEVERARRQVAASALTASLAEETLRAEQERLAAGTSTSLLVAQAQRDLLEAQVAEAASATSYRIALVALFRAEGSLIERRGLHLPD
jgi:outer membrane protein TolC